MQFYAFCIYLSIIPRRRQVLVHKVQATEVQPKSGVGQRPKRWGGIGQLLGAEGLCWIREPDEFIGVGYMLYGSGYVPIMFFLIGFLEAKTTMEDMMRWILLIMSQR